MKEQVDIKEKLSILKKKIFLKTYHKTPRIKIISPDITVQNASYFDTIFELININYAILKIFQNLQC